MKIKRSKKLMSLILCSVLILSVLFTATSCKKKITLEAINESGKLRVATNAEFPPFEFLESNAIVGIDIEIANYIADKAGLEVVIDNLSFDGVLAAIPSGKADIGIAGLNITDERKKSMDFSEPYFDAIVKIIVTSDNSDITDLASLAGKKVGVQIGTVAADIAKEAGNIEVVEMNKDSESILDLIAGRIDAVMIDETPGKIHVSKNDGKIKMTDAQLGGDGQYAIAVQKGSDALLAFINDTLKEMKENGKLEEIISKYIEN